MGKFCSICRATIDADDQFCGECGSPVVYETVVTEASIPVMDGAATMNPKQGSLFVALTASFAIFTIALFCADRIWFYPFNGVSNTGVLDYVYIAYGIMAIVSAIIAYALGSMVIHILELHGTIYPLLFPTIAGTAGVVYAAIYLNTGGGLWSNILFLAQDPDRLGLVLGDVLTFAFGCTVLLQVLRSLISKKSSKPT